MIEKKLRKHVFVCTNQRAEGAPKGCCFSKGSEELLKKLKSKAQALGVGSDIRIQKSGCLDACESGPVVVVYPDGNWYGGVKEADLESIVRRELLEE